MSKNKTYLNRNVLMTGFTSRSPLIQAFVRSITMSAGPVLGVMEGVAESLASLLKVFSGYYSDLLGKRKALTIFGYLLSSLSKMLFFVPNIFALFFVRFFDKVGKGVRTAPRDALISESVPTNIIGKAFVSDAAPGNSKATALGFYNTIVGIGLLPASLIAGFLFVVAPSLPFIFGGVMALSAVVILLFLVD